MIKLHTAPKTGVQSTVDAATSQVVLYDLASAAEALGTFTNCMVTATAILQGRTAGAAYARFTLQRSFAIEANVLTALDASAIVLGTTFLSAALATASVDLLSQTSGAARNIVAEATGVAGETIAWTGYLWIGATSF